MRSPQQKKRAVFTYLPLRDIGHSVNMFLHDEAVIIICPAITG